MEPTRRKVILINPKFQINIISHFVALSLVSIGAFYAANTWFFYKFAQLGRDLNLPSDHIFYQFLNAQKVQMNWMFLGVSLVVMSILFVGGAVISHKVAGPIYRLCQHLRGIQEGKEVKPVSFREGDYFTEIVDHLNPVLEKIEDPTIKTEHDKAS